MKKMTCRELGGGCDLTFTAETFEEMAELSKKHGMEMIKSNDPAHLEAMGAMQKLMQSPEKMQKWFEGRKAHFDGLPHL